MQKFKVEYQEGKYRQYIVKKGGGICFQSGKFGDVSLKLHIEILNAYDKNEKIAVTYHKIKETHKRWIDDFIKELNVK